MSIRHLEDIAPYGAISMEIENGNESCLINLFGATVVSWKVNDTERLFLSEKAIFDGIKPIRGGIPIVYPRFSRPDLALPQHGFARTMKWNVLSSEIYKDYSETILFLSDNDFTREIWNFKFKLFYKIKLSKGELSCDLVIFNYGEKDFNFQALLHTYISLDNLRSIEINGCQEYHFSDKTEGNKIYPEYDFSLIVSKELDRIYFDKFKKQEKSVLIYKNIESKRILYLKSTFSSKIGKIQVSGVNGENIFLDISNLPSEYLSTDFVIWNPWIERCKEISDLSSNDYEKYVCIEPGLVSNDILLSPKEYVLLSQTLSI